MRLNKDGDTDLYTKDRWSSRLGAWVSASEWKPEFPPVARVSVPVPPAPTSRPALATAFKNELRNALAVFRPSRAQASVETITAAPVVSERTESMTIVDDARRDARAWAEKANGTPTSAPVLERSGLPLNMGMFLPLQRPTVERPRAGSD
jgi:hypothetical protein